MNEGVGSVFTDCLAALSSLWDLNFLKLDPQGIPRCGQHRLKLWLEHSCEIYEEKYHIFFTSATVPDPFQESELPVLNNNLYLLRSACSR